MKRYLAIDRDKKEIAESLFIDYDFGLVANRSWKNNGHNPRTTQQKLTKKQVLDIRSSNDTQRKLAKKYNVSHVLIGSVKRMQTYVDVL